MKIKTFFKRWKKGILMVTPEQRMLVDMLSLLIVIFGCLSGVTITLLNKGSWYLTCIFGGVALLQISALVEKYQQYNILKSIKEGLFENGN